MIRKVVQCDVCERDQQQTNNWWVIWMDGCELHLMSMHDARRGEELWFETRVHVCSESCVNTMLGWYMAGGSLEKPSTRTVPAKVCSVLPPLGVERVGPFPPEVEPCPHERMTDDYCDGCGD